MNTETGGEVRMPIGAKYVLMVSMDVAPEKEDLFNEVYDQEHIPNLLAVPGVLSVTRVESEPFAMSIGAERKEMPMASPCYSAIYELESPHAMPGHGPSRRVVGPTRCAPSRPIVAIFCPK